MPQGYFFALGAADTASIGLSFPLGDGSPAAIDSTTITLPTTASTTADFFKGMIALVIAGSGAGQWRSIRAYTTARVATVKAWDDPKPDASSTLVYGVPMSYADRLHLRSEYATTTGATGFFRGEVWAQTATATNRVFSAAVQFDYIAATVGLQAATATAFGGAAAIEVLPVASILGKVFCSTAPTSGTVSVYAAGGSEPGRD